MKRQQLATSRTTMRQNGHYATKIGDVSPHVARRKTTYVAAAAAANFPVDKIEKSLAVLILIFIIIFLTTRGKLLQAIENFYHVQKNEL